MHWQTDSASTTSNLGASPVEPAGLQRYAVARMDKSLINRTERQLAARKTDGNPEGKGVNGFMLDWHKTEPKGVVIKTHRQILAEFFTSMLVLSARFKHRPAVGTANYLYWIDGDWQLSLISPDEWSAERRAAFAGTCVLQHDMTWTIQPHTDLDPHGPVVEAVARFYEAFSDLLNTDLTLEEVLPFYVAKMPYYQRLHASALSRSVRAAVIMGDQTKQPAREWQASLPSVEQLLLP